MVLLSTNTTVRPSAYFFGGIVDTNYKGCQVDYTSIESMVFMKATDGER